MPTRTQAIGQLLNHLTHADLSNLYNSNMECQVNVGQDSGNRVNGEYKGRKWHGWTDGLTTWKSFRVPYSANKNPHYDDPDMSFDLQAHAEGIGMTGWDWKHQLSRWVAFDFDAIIGHGDSGNQLSKTELQELQEVAQTIPHLTIRRSTSGHGIHLYVHLDPPVPTENHTEHAALARAILGQLAALTGYDFCSRVDVCGSNMWVWHRKMTGTNGLELLKQGEPLNQPPVNWRDHLKVIKQGNRPARMQDTNDPLSELAGQRAMTKLDDTHKQLINWLRENNAVWWWEQDKHMLVTHTFHLAQAHADLNLIGYYKTMSEGKEAGIDHNCFLFPVRNGAWSLRRYSRGVTEDASWTQDGQGWTHCYFNRLPDLMTACRAYGGLEDQKGGFVFREAEMAIAAAQLMGISLQVDPAFQCRRTMLKEHKDGRLIMEIDREPNDSPDKMIGWLTDGKQPWSRIFNCNTVITKDPDTANYDDLVRHLITANHEDSGWVIHSDGNWRYEPITHIKLGLKATGLNLKDIDNVLGASVFRAWRLVNKPFESEYPGDREWNRHAAQFRYMPSESMDNLKYGTWLKILDHCGSGLNDAVQRNTWAQANGILTGADYLKCWIASLFQEPTEPLPYLFFYGSENNGKSIFHEALSLLVTRGYQRADLALTTQSGFNGELEGAILCVVEEVDLSSNKQAYNRIKDWVTSRQLNVRHMYRAPYHIPNTTHWVQCANNSEFCPVFPGDTRITLCYVPALDPFDIIPKKAMIPLLEKEASDFLAAILGLELPVSPDRLNVPVITTVEKEQAQQHNKSALVTFLDEFCDYSAGAKIKVGDFHTQFHTWLDPNDRPDWSKQSMARRLPPEYPKGRQHKDGQHYIGNIAWKGVAPTDIAANKYVLRGLYLEALD